jgi:hypothetical protein
MPVTGYLVLSHCDVAQVQRLAQEIVRRSADARVLIAHDDRAVAPPVVRHPRVRVWVHGAETNWGSWELVQVTIDGLRRLREWTDPDMVALASGQDYVCGDLSRWESVFLEGGGGWVGSAVPLEYTPRWGRHRGIGNDHWNRYHYRWVDLPAVIDRVPIVALRQLLVRARESFFLRVEPILAYRVVRRAGRRVVGIRSRASWTGERPVYKGQQMLAVDRRLLDRLLEALQSRRDIVRHYRRSVIPDESLLQTLLSWEQAPRPDMLLTYIGWDTETDGGRYLHLGDLDAVVASGAALCRKVSTAQSGVLCDALDRRWRRSMADGAG